MKWLFGALTLCCVFSGARAGTVLRGVRDIEPNNSMASASTVYLAESQAEHGVCSLTPGDQDYFKFAPGTVADEPAFVAFTTPLDGITGVFNAPDTIIEVFDNSGNPVTNDDDSGVDSPSLGVRGSAVRFVTTQSTPYFVRVRGFSVSTQGRYLLTIARVSGASAFPSWSSVLDVPPPNADVLPVSSRHATVGLSSFDAPGQIDTLALDLRINDILAVSAVGIEGLTADWSTPNLTMSVLAPDGVTALATSTDDSAGQAPGGVNSGVGATIRFKAAASGQYFLRFQPTSSQFFYTIVTSYLPAEACMGDADGNGVVNFADITTVLANFNMTCP